MSETYECDGAADGTILSADLVVAATGVKPHIEFVNGSGVVTDWGIKVDDRLTTSVPGIVAAGDVAEAADWLTGEHTCTPSFPAPSLRRPSPRQTCLRETSRGPYQGAESMNSLKHLGVPIVALGTIDEPDEVLR